jgi:putative ATP-dependent endonuclease of the OLD family
VGVKLARVEIKNYRSIVEAPGAQRLGFNVTAGMNALVGPNNCGKSNVLKAIALALQEGQEGEFLRERDEPAQLTWARPTITLDFVVERPSSPEKTLLRFLEVYEQDALQGEKKTTLASRNRFRLRVKYTNSGRDEFFVTAAGGRRGAPALNQRALDQFRKTVRFVLVRSGESLDEFLAGRFKDLLHTVIRENLGAEVQAAEERREQYRSDVATTLFGPVSRLVSREIAQMIPELKQVQLEPTVLPIDESLATAGISLVDTAHTGLAEKGTGVRGSLLLAMLRYIAENSKRSVIFAVEEPEAFLHPGAQEEVRDDLERLAERGDVTLLVTTHSPFVVSRAAAAQIITIAKDKGGRTHVVEACAGDEDASAALASLFSDTAIPDFLDRTTRLRGNARAFVVVEGVTDAAYLAAAAGRTDVGPLTEGIEIVGSTGAKSAANQAVLLREAYRMPVIVLLDFEALTKPYLSMLRDTFHFPTEGVMTYREWGPAPRTDNPVEAEDLFPQTFLRRFVDEAGEENVVSEKVRTKDGWHYGFNKAGKELFQRFVEADASAAELTTFADVWRALADRVSKIEQASRQEAA